MNKLDKLFELSNQYPQFPDMEPEQASDITSEATEELGELFSTIARLAHDCGVTAEDLGRAFTEGTGIRTLDPQVGVDDIVGEILGGDGSARYRQSATRLTQILQGHIN